LFFQAAALPRFARERLVAVTARSDAIALHVAELSFVAFVALLLSRARGGEVILWKGKNP